MWRLRGYPLKLSTPHIHIFNPDPDEAFAATRGRSAIPSRSDVSDHIARYSRDLRICVFLNLCVTLHEEGGCVTRHESYRVLKRRSLLGQDFVAIGNKSVSTGVAITNGLVVLLHVWLFDPPRALK